MLITGQIAPFGQVLRDSSGGGCAGACCRSQRSRRDRDRRPRPDTVLLGTAALLLTNDSG
jgi:hypothetical protein